MGTGQAQTSQTTIRTVPPLDGDRSVGDSGRRREGERAVWETHKAQQRRVNLPWRQ